MIREVFVGVLGFIVEVKIVAWLKSVGDKVEKAEAIFVVESDKVDLDVESFYDGYLAAILVKEKEIVPVGSVVALIAETEAEIEEAEQLARSIIQESRNLDTITENTNSASANLLVTEITPTFSIEYTIALDAFLQLFQEIKLKGATMNASLAKAVAITLQKHPLLPLNIAAKEITNNKSIDINIAIVRSDGSTIAPILKNVTAVDIYTLSCQWKILAEKAIANKLPSEAYQNGNIIVFNLGMLGVEYFQMNLPSQQAAMLNFGRISSQLVCNPEGSIEFQPSPPTPIPQGEGRLQKGMKLTLTCNSLLLDYCQAISFLQGLAYLLENKPHSLII